MQLKPEHVGMQEDVRHSFRWDIQETLIDRAYHPGGRYWDYCLTATYMKIGIHRWYLWVPDGDLQMCCKDLTAWQGIRLVADNI